MFERESRREKIIEGKMREIRLRVRTRQSEAHSAGSRDSRPSGAYPSAADILLQTAEDEFFQIINQVYKIMFSITFCIHDTPAKRMVLRLILSYVS